jgi:serine/threonine protein kinase
VSGKLRNTEEQLLDIARRIVEVTVMLEQRGFYHQDLKCENIVRRRFDGKIYVIDFGAGTTEGMYPTEHGAQIRRDGADAADAMYILGMTLRQLWTSKHPTEDVQLNPIRNLSAHTIIEDCIRGRFKLSRD